jgi:hypothetical protein
MSYKKAIIIGITLFINIPIVHALEKSFVAPFETIDANDRSDTPYFKVTVGKATYNDKTGNWTLNADSGNPVLVQWGKLGDIPLPGDYDGDGKAEIAVWRPSNATWYISKENRSWSELLGQMKVQWGKPGDIPVPGDYDGDGTTEIAVWRPDDGKWYISTENKSWTPSVPQKIVQWGKNGDIPVPGDYDKDKITEIAVWRPADGYWYISNENHSWSDNIGRLKLKLGQNGDIPVPGAYNSKGQTNIAVWRPSNGTWYIVKDNRSWASSGDKLSIQWGKPGDIPSPINLTGDGSVVDRWFYWKESLHIAIYRPSEKKCYISFNKSWADEQNPLIKENVEGCF